MPTQYAVQKLARISRETCWVDVTEWAEYRPSAEAKLTRFVEDCPGVEFRIAEFTPARKRSRNWVG